MISIMMEESIDGSDRNIPGFDIIQNFFLLPKPMYEVRRVDHDILETIPPARQQFLQAKLPRLFQGRSYRTTLSQFFSRFSIIQEKQGKQKKQERFPKFGNFTEVIMLGTQRFAAIIWEKRKENMENTKSCQNKNNANLDEKSFGKERRKQNMEIQTKNPSIRTDLTRR